MFSFIRWVSGISFLLVMLGVMWFGNEFKYVASEDLSHVVKNSNASLARNFQNGVWKNYRDAMHTGIDWYQKFAASGVPADQWKNYNGYNDMVSNFSLLESLARDAFKQYEDTPVMEVNLYTTSGVLLFSVNQSRNRKIATIAELEAQQPVALKNEPVFARALAGQSPSDVLANETFINPDGSEGKGVLIRGLYPVYADGNLPTASDVVVNCTGVKEGEDCKQLQQRRVIDAVLELRYDVTMQWNELDFFHQISMYGVMGMFSAIILLMLFTSGKAELIIAKQHETNLELAAQASSAQADNSDKSQFLANVSHELRTPLNAIIGFSEFIKSERSGAIGNEKYAEYIRDIHSSGLHLLSLINDILDYSKAEADKLELDIAEVDATKVIKNSMRLVVPRAENAQVQLIEEIPREHFILETDSKKLKQVMLNLLSNSVKFTPSGGSVTVMMWQNVVENSLSIEVRDTGIGIAPKDISRAMAPFGQVDNTLSRKYEGTGLGLPLSRKFVEIMGGTFTIVSEVGKGTAVTITLPKKPKSKMDPVAETTSGPQQESHS